MSVRPPVRPTRGAAEKVHREREKELFLVDDLKRLKSGTNTPQSSLPADKRQCLSQ